MCRSCGRRFTRRNFSINYRLHRTGHLNARIFWAITHNRSNRSIARELGVSEGLIRTRLLRLSTAALRQHWDFVSSITLKEPVAYDGLECFARSQYEPNNINQVVGSDSLFCYFFNFSPLNRKGRISERQKKYLHKLEAREGRFDPQATRKATAEIFKFLAQRKDPSLDRLILQTDEHFHYEKAYLRDLSAEERSCLDHRQVSSRATRNYKNILFPVNHLDLLIRRYMAAFSRETICFAKKHSRMLQKYVLYICKKNYMRPRFVKRHKQDPRANTESPAMHLGLCSKVLDFGDFFSSVEPSTRLPPMPKAWALLEKDEVAFPRDHRFNRAQAA